MKSIISTKLISWLIKRKLMFFIVAVSFVALVLPGAFVCASEITTDEAQQPAVPAIEEQAAPATESEAEVADEGVVIITGEDEETVTEKTNEAVDEGVVIVTGDEEETATEENTEAEGESLEAENATVTVTGTVKTSGGSTISADKDPYVQIAGIYTELILPDTYADRVNVNDDGTFTLENVPSGLNGIITAGADGYSNQILAYPGTVDNEPINFSLDEGATCTFTNDEPKLGSYYLHEGSFFKPLNGSKIEYPSRIGSSIKLGAGMPDFGLPAGATIKENLDYGTITYHYKNAEGTEEHNIILSAAPESGYQFNYWEINDEPIPATGYTIQAGTPITLNPVFTERGKMIVGGIVKDKASGEPIDGAYGYIIGFDITSGEMYYSTMQETDEDGIFTFSDVPDGLKGVIVGGAPGHTTQPQYLSYYVPRTEFNLNPGVVCTIEAPDDLSTVMIEAGSKIRIEGYEEIVLPFPVDLGNEFPPLGFPKDGEMDFKDKGVVEYKFTHDDPEHSVKSLDLILKAYPKSDFAFKNWLLNGEEFRGKLQLSTVEDDFTIKPVFKEATPYTFSTFIKNRQGELITNAYAYLVGIHESTGGMYLTSPVQTDSQGVFSIENIPYDVYGLVVVGAPGYVNRFEFIDCDTEATFFTLDEGVQISFDMPKTASTVLIEKGSSVSVIVEGIPLTFDLPENIDFGSMFLPFGITPQGTFKFLNDGKLNYNFTRQDSNRVDIQELNITFDVLPNEGYVFKDWLKNGEVVTGTEYTLQAGDVDFVLTPVFEEVVPPQPTPVDPTVDPTVTPTGMAKTFDSIEDWCVALAILFAAFMVVYSTRKFILKK